MIFRVGGVAEESSLAELEVLRGVELLWEGLEEEEEEESAGDCGGV